jgi:hypothetical protein
MSNLTFTVNKAVLQQVAKSYMCLNEVDEKKS